MKEQLDRLHDLLFTAQRSAGVVQIYAINQARLLVSKMREVCATFDPADMATAAAQGFRDGQAQYARPPRHGSAIAVYCRFRSTKGECEMKDHEIANCIGAVTAIAKEFHSHQSLRERIAQVLRPALAGGAFDPADMATAAAQGFRDGQAVGCERFDMAEPEDTTRLRFVAENFERDESGDIVQRCIADFPNGIHTLDDLRKLIDIRRGAA